MLLRKLELWQTAVSYSRKFNLGVGNREKADTGSTAAAADSGYSRKYYLGVGDREQADTGGTAGAAATSGRDWNGCAPRHVTHWSYKSKHSVSAPGGVKESTWYPR
jgi:hypothetical protein